KFPEASYVETSNGNPKKLFVTVIERSAFTVSVAAPNRLLRNASNGGVCKTGSGGGAGGCEGGGAGGGDGGAAETVSVAAVLVAVPALLVKTAPYWSPFIDRVTLFSVS